MAHARALQPTCVMCYDRQAFVGHDAEESLRVTFDDRLRYRFRDLELRVDDGDFDGEILDREQSVLEVKVDRVVPYWLSVLAGRHRCVLQSVSKYAGVIEDAGVVDRSAAHAGRPATALDDAEGAAPRGPELVAIDRLPGGFGRSGP